MLNSAQCQQQQQQENISMLLNFLINSRFHKDQYPAFKVGNRN